MKTLKDFYTEDNHYDFEDIDLHCYLLNPMELRQEAIKWYNEFNRVTLKKFSQKEIEGLEPYDQSHGYNGFDAEEFIKKFFNLTDEELK